MKPSDIPVQRPESIDQVHETTRVFIEAVKQTMHKIAIDTYNGEQQPEKYRKTLEHAHERYFRSMKGATNTQLEDVNELIEGETRRQTALYNSIEELKPYFDSLKPIDPTNLYAHPYWDHGPSHGLNIEINGTRFYSLPRVPCSTNEYITIKQAPVPANIVLINKDMILMLPYREDPTEETRRQLNKLLDVSGKIEEAEIEASIHVAKNYLWVHSEEKIDEKLINNLIEKYGVDAFMVGYSGRNLAFIYTGLEESIDRLWKTVYFDWDQMWRRYGWYEKGTDTRNNQRTPSEPRRRQDRW